MKKSILSLINFVKKNITYLLVFILVISMLIQNLSFNKKIIDVTSTNESLRAEVEDLSYDLSTLNNREGVHNDRLNSLINDGLSKVDNLDYRVGTLEHDIVDLGDKFDQLDSRSNDINDYVIEIAEYVEYDPNAKASIAAEASSNDKSISEYLRQFDGYLLSTSFRPLSDDNQTIHSSYYGIDDYVYSMENIYNEVGPDRTIIDYEYSETEKMVEEVYDGIQIVIPKNWIYFTVMGDMWSSGEDLYGFQQLVFLIDESEVAELYLDNYDLLMMQGDLTSNLSVSSGDCYIEKLLQASSVVIDFDNEEIKFYDNTSDSKALVIAYADGSVYDSSKDGAKIEDDSVVREIFNSISVNGVELNSGF